MLIRNTVSYRLQNEKITHLLCSLFRDIMSIRGVVRYGDLFCQSDWSGEEAELTVLHDGQAFTGNIGRCTLNNQCFGSVFVHTDPDQA